MLGVLRGVMFAWGAIAVYLIARVILLPDASGKRPR
jgi:hypothetical protein